MQLGQFFARLQPASYKRCAKIQELWVFSMRPYKFRLPLGFPLKPPKKKKKQGVASKKPASEPALLLTASRASLQAWLSEQSGWQTIGGFSISQLPLWGLEPKGDRLLEGFWTKNGYQNGKSDRSDPVDSLGTTEISIETGTP